MWHRHVSMRQATRVTLATELQQDMKLCAMLHVLSYIPLATLRLVL